VTGKPVRSSPHWPTGASTVVGTIGYPIDHSMSPLLHQSAFDALGLDWVSVAFPVAPGQAPAALDGMRALGIVGLSVTMPHKSDVADAVEVLTPLAQRLGAVNCVINRNGRLIGDSTDGAGLLEALRREAEVYPEGKRCVVIGAGGAGRAAVAALAGAGAAEVAVVNRSESRAIEAAELAGPVGRTDGPDAIARADIVIHATPSGMPGQGALPTVEDSGAGGSNAISSYLHSGQVVMDLVYVPRMTPLLVAAEASGATVVGGLGMLIYQAGISLEHWTERPAPLAAMWAAALEASGDVIAGTKPPSSD